MVDCCLNAIFIPENTISKVIIPPSGKTYFNGLAKSYDAPYSIILANNINETEFNNMIYSINLLLRRFKLIKDYICFVLVL